MRRFICLIICTLMLATSQGQPAPPPEEKQLIQLSKLPVSYGRDTAVAYLHDRCARHWIIQGMPQRADEHLRRFEAINKNYTWPFGEALLLYRKGHYQTVLGNATQAKSYFLRALERLIHLNHPEVLLAAYTQMSANELNSDWADSTSTQVAIRYLQKGRKISLKTPKRLFYSALCYQLGRAYLQLQDYKQARYYLTESWQESQRTGYKEMTFYHSLLFTICYLHLGDPRHRQTWKSCQSYLPNLSNQEYFDYFTALSAMHRFEQEPPKLLSDGLNMLSYATAIKSPTKVLQSRRIVFEAYKLLNQPQSALQELEIIKQLEDSTQRQRSKVLLAELQLKYDAKQHQAELARLTIENQRSQSRVLLGSILILVVLLGIIVYSNRRLRQKNQAIRAALLRGQALERQRVAADLHDNLGTTLSALRWTLEAMDRSKLSLMEQNAYATISLQVDQAYNDVRLLSHNLLPDELARQGLPVALQALLTKLNHNTSVWFKLTGIETLPRLNAQTEFELYSVCLELLNNTIKHAKATEGYISFSQENGMLHLTVGDNGVGFSSQRKDGQGLRNVTARVNTLGGMWQVDFRPEGGIRNQIVVPLKTAVRVSSRT
ncbi:tetratricopeptide repeat-containing sensor histidine kinase [Spirosoma endbachense]|uniref:histidine kinase n=1 Tax=Spirosoma endbachense TaxID=2666025 RepID=A0A6P1VW26_9BACT|nr:histidine kinase [Spirosoma endbachense]QHV97313.1 hypothetical protein GJR95_20900 [Spirosoma endbachense]